MCAILTKSNTINIFLAFYRRDHLRKHLQTHSKAFLESRSAHDKGYLEVKEEPEEGMDEDIHEEILNEVGYFFLITYSHNSVCSDLKFLMLYFIFIFKVKFKTLD